MRCLDCAAENPAQDGYCQACGSLLPRPCMRCANVNRPDAAFCGQCGSVLDGEREITPGAQVSKLVDGLRYGLEGERKLVTVLFADVVNSSEYIRDMDPEDSVQAMERPLERMIASVRQYEGTVSRVQGDGIMAIFGAPRAHEDDAVRACLAGLEMQRAMMDLDAEGLQIRVGLNSGTVVIRSLTNDLWAEYDASGPVVNLASRMEQLAKPGTVCCSESTYALAKDFIEMQALGSTQVRGFGSPVLRFQPIRPLLAVTRWQVRAGLGLSAFVGRTAEYERCIQLFQHATAERGQVILITGEAGMGKSRLVHEVVRSVVGHLVPVHETSALPHASKGSLMPISRLLRLWLNVQDRDVPERVREKLRQGLEQTVVDPTAIQPPLESLLDLPVMDIAWTGLDSPERRERILSSIETFIQARAARVPAVIVFEDVHWNDADTNVLLERLIARIESTRLLLVATSRPEFEPPWAKGASCTRIEIGPFSQQLTMEFLRRTLGDGPAHRRLGELLWTRTQGIPLYLEEAVRALVESGALLGERGNLQLVREVETLEVPETLQAVIAARIDRLAPELKRLVQTASVIGAVVPFALLRAVTGLADGVLRRRLAQLQAAGLFYESRLVPDLEFTFMHVLAHDVAYESLLVRRRRTLHALVVEAIERHHANRLTEHAEALAHHSIRGDLPAKAFAYLVQVGDRAMDNCAYPAAIESFESALSYLERLPMDRLAIEMRIDVRLRLRAAIGVTGDYRRWLTYLEEAERLAEQIDDEKRRAAINVSRTHVLNVVGNANDAAHVGRKAATIAVSTKDSALIVSANYFLAQAYEFLGDYRRSIPVLQSSLHAVTGKHRHARMGTTGTSSVLYLSLLAYCCAFLGQFRRGAAYSARACKIATEVNRPFDIGVACFADGVLSTYRGDLTSALGSLERGFAACEQGGIHILLPVLASRLAYVYALLGGRVEQSIELGERAVREAENMPHMLGWCLAYLGLVQQLTGHRHLAQDFGERARELAEQHGYRGLLMWARWLLGGAAEPATDAQLNHYRAAIELADSLALAPHAAISRTDLSRAYHRIGLHEEAQQELTAAVRSLRRLGAGCWLQSAEGDLDTLTDVGGGLRLHARVLQRHGRTGRSPRIENEGG